MGAQTVITHAQNQGEPISLFDLSAGDHAAVIWSGRVVPFVVLEGESSSMLRVKITGEFRNGDVVYVHATERIISLPARALTRVRPYAGAPVRGWLPAPDRADCPLTAGGRCLLGEHPMSARSAGRCSVCGAVPLFDAPASVPAHGPLCTWCDHLAVTRVDGDQACRACAGAPAGVSLVKAGDDLAPWERDLLFMADAGHLADAVDRAVAMGPIGVGPMLARNDLRALACTLDVMTRLGGGR